MKTDDSLRELRIPRVSSRVYVGNERRLFLMRRTATPMSHLASMREMKRNMASASLSRQQVSSRIYAGNEKQSWQTPSHSRRCLISRIRGKFLFARIVRERGEIMSIMRVMFDAIADYFRHIVCAKAILFSHTVLTKNICLQLLTYIGCMCVQGAKKSCAKESTSMISLVGLFHIWQR